MFKITCLGKGPFFANVTSRFSNRSIMVATPSRFIVISTISLFLSHFRSCSIFFAYVSLCTAFSLILFCFVEIRVSSFMLIYFLCRLCSVKFVRQLSVY